MPQSELNDGVNFVDLNGLNSAIVFRFGQELHVWENSCPHAGMPLDMGRETFLVSKNHEIVCLGHGAVFDLFTGKFLGGPGRCGALCPLYHEIEGENIKITFSIAN